MKKLLKGFVLRFIPRKKLRIILNKPLLVPSYYKRIIDPVEHIIDYQQNAPDSCEDEHILQLIRKYAHILDKGLHRTDLESGHSREIYIELKNLLNVLEDRKFVNDPTYEWAIEKIKTYELLQEGNPLDPLEEKKREDHEPVNFDLLFRHMRERRSNRYFLDIPVTQPILKKIVEPVNWAPTSCNKQPVKIFATINPGLTIQCTKQCKGATGFSNYIPGFLSFCADLRGYSMPSEIFLPYIDCSLGAQNVFLAAHSIGLSTSVLSWAQSSPEEETALRSLLSIPEHYAIIFNAVIGYASRNACPPVRKPLDKTISIIE
jgi:hypothetical protein